jgi:FdhD protein
METLPKRVSPKPVAEVELLSVLGVTSHCRTDQLAVEEPLTVLVTFGPVQNRQREVHSITMRTPGKDDDLAAGLLFSDRVITEPEQILAIHTGYENNQVRVELHPDVLYDRLQYQRRGVTASSCGVCGKTSVEAVVSSCDTPLSQTLQVSYQLIHSLPEKLRLAQDAFSQTGGLHAAGLFDEAGNLLRICEDVGRHNAVDKLIGAELRAGNLPLSQRILLVGVPIFAAVGAPSSLAVQLAQEAELTLLGFVRDQRFNVYSGMHRLHQNTENQ